MYRGKRLKLVKKADSDWVLRLSAVDLSEGEDIPEPTRAVAETGDHGRRPKLPSEPQTGMAANEIVMTTYEFKLPVQSLLTTRMGRTASTQIGDRLPDCQIESLDIRRVRMRRIFRFVERLLQSSGRANNRSTLHSRDAVFPPGLDDLCVDASNSEQPTDHAFVELEAIRHNLMVFQQLRREGVYH